MRKLDESVERRGERGMAMITAVIGLVALILAAALAIDVGHVLVARTQAQAAIDSASLAGAASLIDVSSPSNPVVTRGAATAAAQLYSSSNKASPAQDPDGVDVLAGDVQFGNWIEGAAPPFQPPATATDPNTHTAVRVTGRLDGNANPVLGSMLAQVFGRDSFTIDASATAYLGWAGSSGPGEVELPIALDCCEIQNGGAACNGNYCPHVVNNPPNLCDLTPAAQQDAGLNSVTCLEFHSTPEQNSCWTQFDPDSSSVNTPGLIDIIVNGAPPVGTEPVYLDNGDKTPVISEISDRFYGHGAYTNNASGDDYYPPKDGVSDSWVTSLPVVECQDDAECAGGDPMRIIGFACFEIREVLVTPEKIIKGTLMCPSHPRFDTECGVPGSGSGGFNFGLRAEIPVLVD